MSQSPTVLGLALSVAWLMAWPIVAAAEEEQARPLLTRLDPVSRAKVVMALLALVLSGLAIVGLAWYGARRLRRIARQPARPTVDRQDAWYQKPLTPPEPGPGRKGE